MKSAKIAQFCKKGPKAMSTSGSFVSSSFFKAYLFCGIMPDSGNAMPTLINVEDIFSTTSAPFRFEQLAAVTPLSPRDGSSGNRLFYGAFNRDPNSLSSIGICLFDEQTIKTLFAKSPFVQFSSSGGSIKPNLPVVYGTETLKYRPNNVMYQRFQV